MESQRQLLRVSVKLMGLTVIVFFIYILFSGMFASSDESKEVAATFDISMMAAGELKQIKFNGRDILLLRRDDNMMQALLQPNPQLYKNIVLKKPVSEWFVAYAFDPLLGCEVKFSKDQFRSVCGGQQYDLAGRPYKNQQSQMELLQPAYKVDAQQLMIFSN